MQKMPLSLPKALFSRTRIERRFAVDPAALPVGARLEWVIDRRACLFRCFDLTAVPPRKRQAALQMEIGRWSPFEQHGQYVSWSAGLAQVWIWDARRFGPPETHARNSECLPESVLRGRPAEQDLQILQCWDCVEARFWRNGVLKACYSWPEMPRDREWQRFCRDCSLPVTTPVPDAVESPLLQTPWSVSQGGRVVRERRVEHLLVAAALFLVMAGIGWQGARWLSLIWNGDVLAQAIEAANDRAEPILGARARTLENDARLRSLWGLLAHPDQIKLMSMVAMRLQEQQPRFVEWHFNGRDLKVLVAGKGTDSLRYVTALQAEPAFTAVTVEPGNQPGTLLVTLKIQEADGV